MAKKTYHHGDLRNTLLETAQALLNKRGVAGLSLRAIAREANVSSAAPYRHFKDKTALLEAVAEAGFQVLIDACRQAEEKFPEDPKAQFFEMGYAYILFAVQNVETHKLMFGGSIDLKKAGPSLKQTADSAITHLSRIIQNGQDRGLYKPHSNFELSLAAWSMAHGISALLSAGLLDEYKDEDAIRKISHRLAEILLEGMLK